MQFLQVLLKNGILVDMKRNLFLFNVKFVQWHICITFLRVLLWSLPSTSYCTIRMSSGKSNTFGRPLNNSLVFPWNMSPTGATPKGSILFNVDLRCISHLSAWLSFVGSRHSHTIPFCFSTMTKLFHYSPFSSMSSGSSSCCSCSLSNTF